jgi:hypothetical protein
LPAETTAHKLYAMPHVPRLVSLRRQADHAKFSRKKRRGNPAHLSLGNSHALT